MIKEFNDKEYWSKYYETILKSKKMYDKRNMNKVSYSNKITTNEVNQKSFVSKFLGSLKQKLYGQKK